MNCRKIKAYKTAKTFVYLTIQTLWNIIKMRRCNEFFNKNAPAAGQPVTGAFNLTLIKTNNRLNMGKSGLSYLANQATIVSRSSCLPEVWRGSPT